MVIAATCSPQEMTAVVCDASVLFKLLVAEPNTREAFSLVQSRHILVPAFVFLEIANALWTRTHRGLATAADALGLLDDLKRFALDVQSTELFAGRALALALELDHPVYDCIYLALAENRGIPLVTADQRFLRALERTKWAGSKVIPLSEIT
jgi:predicted nucleic acid-binding protein